MSEDASALRRLLDVVGQLGAERRSEPVLRSILDAARDLAGARYAVLLDLVLPGLSGVDTARRLRDAGVQRRVPTTSRYSRG